MKRIINISVFLLTSSILLSFLVMPAAAASFKTQADSLNSMGLFLGTGKGYELERIPNRAEAAVMLVRLLGKEAEVKSGVYKHPFKDIPAWVNNYIGYLYETGLVKGTSPTTFSPGIVCSDQMFCVLALRALGYTEDNGSFTYEQAQDFADSIGLTYHTDDAKTFLRDDLVAISYAALFQQQKDSTLTLLEKLIADQAVSQSSAQASLNYFYTYKEYVAACLASYIDTSTELRNITKSNFNISGQSIDIEETHNMKTVVDGDGISFFLVGDVMDIQYREYVEYYADGWLYSQAGGQWIKEQVSFSMEDYLSGINLTYPPFYLINAITKSSAQTGTVYVIDYAADAFSALLGSQMASYDAEINNFSIGSLKETVTLGSDGKLKTQRLICGFDADIIISEQRYRTSASIDSVMTLLAYGDTVKITPPNNLADYTVK